MHSNKELAHKMWYRSHGGGTIILGKGDQKKKSFLIKEGKKLILKNLF
jgi:hypothetical protein